MFTKYGTNCFPITTSSDNKRLPADVLLCAVRPMMDIFKIVMITLHITHVFTRKYASTSDESIENLLYYKGCQHKAKAPTDTPMLMKAMVPPPQRPQPECAFPKMCCSLSCGEDCGSKQPLINRQMDPMSNIQTLQPIQPAPMRNPQAPIQPQNQRGRKKKGQFPPPMQMPIPSRRNIGFTKEKIKSLMSRDEDIRKILKDLVRVTMKKVDLMNVMTAQNTESVTNAAVTDGSDEDDDDYEFE